MRDFLSRCGLACCGVLVLLALTSCFYQQPLERLPLIGPRGRLMAPTPTNAQGITELRIQRDIDAIIDPTWVTGVQIEPEPAVHDDRDYRFTWRDAQVAVAFYGNGEVPFEPPADETIVEIVTRHIVWEADRLRANGMDDPPAGRLQVRVLDAQVLTAEQYDRLLANREIMWAPYTTR